MKNKYKYLVFDFDGVICESTNECMVTAWNTWEKLYGRNTFRTKLSEFSKNQISSFKLLRPYVRGAGEYYIILKVINTTDYDIHNQKSYDQLKYTWENEINSFKDTFYDQRQILKQKSTDSWVSLHHVYQDVIEFVRKINLEKRLLIATLKDFESVSTILEYNGVFLKKENILDQSSISSKLEGLEFFRKERNLDKNNLCFIDDNVTHLQDPHQNGYDVFLSSWGNTLSEHIEIAKKNGIPILNSVQEMEE